MSTANASDLPQVQRILQRCRRQILRHTIFVGVATLVAAVVGYLLSVSLLDYAFGLPNSFRVLILLCFAAMAILVTWKFIVVPLRSSIPSKELSAAVDLSCPDLHESLTTLISIQSPSASSSEAGSAFLRDRLEHQVTEQLHGLKSQQFVNTDKMKKRCGVAASAVVLAVIPFLLWPSASGLSVRRIFNPFANLAAVSNLFFEIEDGNRTVARGSSVVLQATPQWRSGDQQQQPNNVAVELFGIDGQVERQPMAYDEVNGCYTTEIFSVQQDLQYRISGGGTFSETCIITVVDAPAIDLAIMTATPPAYCGRSVETFDGMIEEMKIFERSEIVIQLQFNKPVESATLVWNRRDERPLTELEKFDIQFDNLTGEESVPEFDLEMLNPEPEPLPTEVVGQLSDDRMSAVLKMEADVGGDFEFLIVDEFKLTNSQEPERSMSVVYDLPPELSVSGVRTNDRYRPADILPINCLAIDDVGLGVVELHYFINTNPTVVVAATEFKSGAFEVAEKFRLNLEDFELKDGDSLNIRVRAVDERPIPGPQEVWSEDFNIDIDKDAKPPGARAMEQQTQEMIEGLKELERRLEKDQAATEVLKTEARQEWKDLGREKAQRLSEKEQRQGRILQQLTNQVATHPLMQDAAEKLQQLTPEVRDELPELFEKAADQQRNLAAETLGQTANKIDSIRKTLRQQIQEIEERAKLEQDLAELNRLALDAEKLANDADRLETDRQSSENKPSETSQKDWEQQLEDRQMQLSQEREELTDDIENLLDDEEQLRQAAQRAQMESFEAIQESARRLAEQQTRVADGVDFEAKQIATDAQQTVRDLQESNQQAKQLGQQLQQQDLEGKPLELQKLEEAIRQLNEGNLAAPLQQVRQLADELTEASGVLEVKIAGTTQTSEQQLQTKQAAKLSKELAAELNKLAEQIQQLKKDRMSGATAAKDSPTPDLTPVPATEELEQSDNQISPNRPVMDLMKRIDKLADAAKDLSSRIQMTPEAGNAAQQAAKSTSQKADAGRQEAYAGQFTKSAQQFRNASQSAMEANASLKATEGVVVDDQQRQMRQLAREFNNVAEALENLKQNNSAQAAAQQQAQQKISDQVSKLPEELADLAERMAMEALQMQQQAQQANAAEMAAQQAQQSASQATQQLQDAQVQQAAQSGMQAADLLNQVANGATQSSQQEKDPNSLVPTEVGESVADALQNLQKAAEAMKQASDQQSQGESGESGESAEQGGESGSGEPGQDGQSASSEGKPGEGQTGEGQQQGQGKPSQQQLDAAAKSLAQAAAEALPGQFNPNQPPSQNDSQQAGKDAMGNAIMWDGKLPDDVLERIGGSRNWGKVVDELDSETMDSINVSRDNEYQSLIRMYFKELAKSIESTPKASSFNDR